MSLHKDLRDRLLGSATIATIVGAKVRSGKLGQSDRPPAIVLHLIDSFSEESLTGPIGFAVTRFQINCYQTTYELAEALAKAVRVRLHQFRGTMGDTVVSTISLESGVRSFDEGVDGGSDISLIGMSQDFKIYHQQAIV